MHLCNYQVGTAVRGRSVSATTAGAALSAFLGYVEVLDFPDVASTHYARIRVAMKTMGTMIGANDLFIAATPEAWG
jgi:predicted nucleic acid-binding protein